MLDCLFALRWTTHTPTTSRCLCLSACVPRLSLAAASLTLVRPVSAGPGSVHALPTGPNWQVCCPPSTCHSAERLLVFRLHWNARCDEMINLQCVCPREHPVCVSAALLVLGKNPQFFLLYFRTVTLLGMGYLHSDIPYFPS